MQYNVYVKTDENGRVTAINSDAFLHSTDGWTLIDSGDGDKYQHAQGNYFAKPVANVRGVYLYKLVDGVVMERTPEEIEADMSALPQPGGTGDNRIEECIAQVQEMKTTLAAYESAYLEGVQSA